MLKYDTYVSFDGVQEKLCKKKLDNILQDMFINKVQELAKNITFRLAPIKAL